MTRLPTAGRARRRPHPRRKIHLSHAVVGCAVLAASAATRAQTAPTVIAPSLTLSQTFTDNRELSATNKRAEGITQVSPGISISSRSGLLQGYLNYTGTGVLHSRDTQLNEYLNALDARGTAAFIDRRLLIDASARISQQAVSAFGVQSTDPALTDRNRTEVHSYTLTPSLRGRLLGEVDYQARLAYAASRSSSTSIGDTESLSGSLGISGGRGVFGWGLDGERTVAENGLQNDRRTLVGSVRASLSYRYDFDWQFYLRAGKEANNVVNTSSTATWGGGASWSPGPRTQASVNFDKRFFGHSHSVTLSHRFARTVVSFTDSRDLSTGGVGGASAISLFDLYFQLFATVQPNPALREALVREFLRQNGLDPSTRVSSGFLSSGNSVQRRSTLSVAMQGVRNTLNASLFVGTSTRLGAVVAEGDLANVDQVRQSGLTINWTYRLTPTSSFSLTGNQQRSSGSGSQPGTGLRTLVAAWSSALGDRTSVSLSVRHSVSDGDLNPYTESALIGSMSMRF